MSLAERYFENLYSVSVDPWEFRTRLYEIRKRAVTLACLPEPRYSSVFEPGCSIGVLSAELASRSDHVLAMDISALALSVAARAVPPNVELRQGAVPDDWPRERFDLVVLSEVGYYLDEADCRRLGDLAARDASDLIVTHWRHPVADYPLPGDEVHRIVGETSVNAGMTRVVRHVEDDFRLDVWSHDRRSVALRTGVPLQTVTER